MVQCSDFTITQQPALPAQLASRYTALGSNLRTKWSRFHISLHEVHLVHGMPHQSWRLGAITILAGLDFILRLEHGP